MKHAREGRTGQFLAMTGLALSSTLLFGPAARAEDDPAKAQDKRLQQAYDQAQARDRQNAGTTTKADQAARAKEQAKRDVAEFKQNMTNNLASIKELSRLADADMKEKKFAEAGQFYGSVAMADVPGSEDYAEQARNNLQKLEDMAKDCLHEAEDADIQRDYIKEAERFLYILQEFPFTKAKERALAGITSLRSRPEVAAFEEFKKGEQLEADGKLIDAEKAYEGITLNPRYDHSVAALLAKRKLDAFGDNEQTRAAKKAELDARAKKEAPSLMASAKNYLANNMPKEAMRKLQDVIDRYPNTSFAEEAQKQLAELK